VTQVLTYVEVDVPEFASPEQLDPTLTYDFTTNSLIGWAPSADATLTATTAAAILTQTGDDPQMISPAALTIDGAANRYIRIDIERTALRTAGIWNGVVFYSTGGHGFSGSFFKLIPEVANVVGAREVIVLDMGDLDAGGGDWITNTITRIRLDFDDNQVANGGTGTSTGGEFAIRSIMVGSLAQGRAARFDGGTYATRGGGLTSAANSKMLTASFWFKIAEGHTGGRILHVANSVGGGDTGVTRLVLAGGTTAPNFVGTNAAGTEIVNINGGSVTTGFWHHALLSFDLSDPAKRHFYVDDVSTLTVGTYIDDTIDFTKEDWAVGARPDGNVKYSGDLADLWFAPGVYFDLSVEQNRRKFISDLKSPVDLGAMGELPTTIPPAIFLSGPAAGWQVNRGYGGGFTLVGSPTALLDPGPVTETWRFAQPTSYLPREIPAIASIESVSLQPATISLGQNLGQRASISVTLNDHLHRFGAEPYDRGTFWGKWRGRYGTKLRGCPLRVIRGQVGQAVSAMDTRHYIVDTTDGPTFGAKYTFTAKDILKVADDDRAQAPVLSNGSLAGTISAVAVSATLSPVGIGNLEYPASGWVCIGGKEVVSFTRAGDVLTIVRAQFGTVASLHDAGDRVQLVLRYTGDDAADIIQDLLVNYAGVPASTIDLAEWQAETSAFLNVIYAATITEPTSVNKLVSELIEQAALAVWWDDRAKQVRLQVLREISTDADTFTHERMLEGSFSVKEQPTKRISQIWTYYGQRDPTDSGANEDCPNRRHR
jgi:hypothetical protein